MGPEELTNSYRQLPKNGWISVKDQLPGRSCEVLVCLNNPYSVFTAEYYKGKFDLLGYIGDSGKDQVTHWMPLPEPPK